MPRLSIQQFRATLAGLSDQGPFVRAYRAPVAPARSGGGEVVRRMGDVATGRRARRAVLTCASAGASRRRSSVSILSPTPDRRSTMTRMSIQQFRAALADSTNASGALRAYREIARSRARLATGGWIPWGVAAMGWAAWPAAGSASTRGPVARFAAWGDWAGPPADARAA